MSITLSEHEIAQAEERIAQAIAILDYGTAAGETFVLAQATQAPATYARSASYFFLAGNYEASQELAIQLINTAGLVDEQLILILGMSLYLREQSDDAKQIFQTPGALSLKTKTWIEQLFENESTKGISSLASKSYFDAQILEASGTSDNNVLKVELELHCGDCQKNYRGEIRKSLFRFDHVPCPHCFRPYVTRPLAVAKKLEEFAAKIHPDEPQSLDMLINTWSHNWWTTIEMPKAAIINDGEILFEKLYFTLRYGLGELLNKGLNNQAKKRRGENT